MSSQNEIVTNFFALHSREDVASLLGVEDKALRYFLYCLTPKKLYSQFTILKKNGSLREISAPHWKLKKIQKKLANVLAEIFEPSAVSYAYHHNKSIRDNAIRHIKQRIVLNIDLKDFFGQIHFGRIQGMLEKPPYSIGKKAAIVIAQIATLDGKLPQGSPSSPILSNMICSSLDRHLLKFAKKSYCKYTRYADDITFSTSKMNLPTSLAYFENNNLCLGEELTNIFELQSFKVNYEKIHLRKKFQRQEVTGLTVNQFPNVRREYLKTLRAIIHNCNKDGLYKTAREYINKGNCNNKINISQLKFFSEEKLEEWFKGVLIGKVNYIKQVRGRDSFTFLALANDVNILLDKRVFDTSLLDTTNDIICKNLEQVSFEYNEEIHEGSGFFVKNYGFFTCEHVIKKTPKFVDFYSYFSKTTKKRSTQENIICQSEQFDYTLLKFENPNENSSFELGNSRALNIGDKVTLAGFPEYCPEDTPNIQTCDITSMTRHFQAPLYVVSGRVVHGASGGVVLDSENKVVGIIRSGTASTASENSTNKYGFIPIHCIIEDIEKQKNKICNA